MILLPLALILFQLHKVQLLSEIEYIFIVI